MIGVTYSRLKTLTSKFFTVVDREAQDEIGKSLVNNSIGTDTLGNFLLGTAESNQFFCVREVNTIDVGIPTKGLAIESHCRKL